MKKIIFRLWLINILLGIGLFFLYRGVINELNYSDVTILGKFYSIIDVFLQVLLSTYYLVAIVFTSLSFFLNQIERVRNSCFLSLSTFAGIPFLFVIFLFGNLLLDIYQYNLTPAAFKTLLGFSIIYLLCTIIEFLMFRKKIKDTNKGY
jgi:hypothetical protein